MGVSRELMMPASRKGKGNKAKSHYPVPISADLAERLAAPDRPAKAPLLTRPGGQPWKRSNQAYPFRRVARACGQDPAEVTMYALRHSSIVRQLLAGVPVRIVAAGHDTSVAMIERNYSRYITDHADALVRGAMLDLTPRDKPKLAVIGESAVDLPLSDFPRHDLPAIDLSDDETTALPRELDRIVESDR